MKPKSVAIGYTIERNVVINGTHIHVKSIFKGNIPLAEALANIAKRKLVELEKNDKPN